jgi:hypothetical protein
LIIVVLFYWSAFCLSIIAWLKAIAHLCFGNFIRGTIWLAIGSGLLFWWTGSDVSFDTWLHGSATIVGLSVLATLLRYSHRATSRSPRAVPATRHRPTIISLCCFRCTRRVRVSARRCASLGNMGVARCAAPANWTIMMAMGGLAADGR